MATPILTVETRNYQFAANDGAVQLQISGTALDLEGAAVDIDTGFTLFLAISHNPNSIFLSSGSGLTAVDLNTDGTWSAVISASGQNQIPRKGSQFQVLLSDDAGTTYSPVQKGTMTFSDMRS